MSDTTLRAPKTRGMGEVIEKPFLRVVYQSGFPKDVGVNGCRVEDVIEEAMERLARYQAGFLACDENAEALSHLSAARAVLIERIHRRQIQGVLNTLSRHETIRTEDQDHDFSATGA